MKLVNIAGKVAPQISVNWEGKEPGYYVHRVARDGRISGHLTASGGWSTVYKAARFDTAEAALASVGSAKRVEILANRIPAPAAPLDPANFYGCPAEGARVLVQGYEFTVQNVTVEPQGAGFACRFTGVCTSDPRNDSIRHTSYNGGRYGWRVSPKEFVEGCDPDTGEGYANQGGM